jgi:hypothetical protein
MLNLRTCNASYNYVLRNGQSAWPEERARGAAGRRSLVAQRPLCAGCC